MIQIKQPYSQKQQSTASSLSPYFASKLLQKLLINIERNQPLRIAFLDIDATMTGDPVTTNKTRQLLEEHGYGVIFVTARTEEMLMSSPCYAKAVGAGFQRPQPKLLRENGVCRYIPPEQYEPEGLLDPDIIAGSSGTQIFIQDATDTYRLDTTHSVLMKEPSDLWRAKALHLVTTIDPEGSLAKLSVLEEADNYFSGVCDVYQPLYRISVTFATCKDKIQFTKRFRQLLKENHPLTVNMRMTDDSHLEVKQFAIEITPQHGGKRLAVNHMIRSLRAILPTERPELDILIAGDKFQDLRMGLKAAEDAKVTFLLPGGSTVAQALMDPDSEEFAGEDLAFIRDQLQKTPTGGMYVFGHADARRNVIIGDQAYGGTLGVETIFSYLDTYERKQEE